MLIYANYLKTAQSISGLFVCFFFVFVFVFVFNQKMQIRNLGNYQKGAIILRVLIGDAIEKRNPLMYLIIKEWFL